MYLTLTKNNKGFSIVHLMIVMAVMGIIVSFAAVNHRNTEKSMRAHNISLDIEIIENKLKENNSVGNPLPLGEKIQDHKLESSLIKEVNNTNIEMFEIDPLFEKRSGLMLSNKLSDYLLVKFNKNDFMVFHKEPFEKFGEMEYR